MTSTTTARTRLAVALDVPDLHDAAAIAAAVSGPVDVAKVGLQLFSAYGPAAVDRIKAEGLDIFLDVKLHDIPNTVGSAAVELGRLGVRYVTVHASGGKAMVEAARAGLSEGHTAAGLDGSAPGVLAVTQLTSLPSAPTEVMEELLAHAEPAEGIVCSVSDLGVIKQYASDKLAVTPGIRPAGVGADDQVRVATPAAAIEAGAGLLVVGRAITRAADPAEAATSVRAEMDDA